MINFLFILFNFSINAQIINEYKFFDNNPNIEWIEIYNENNYVAVLENWTISNSNQTITLPKILIQEKSYIILARKKSEVVKKYNLDSEKVFEISLNDALGANDFLVLKYKEDLIDSVAYDSNWFNSLKSIERMDIAKPFNKDKWKNSISKLGSTPLKENSVKLVDFNISILNVEYDGTYLNIAIENNGNLKLEKFDFYIYFDWNFDKIINDDEVIYSQLGLEIANTINFKYKLEDILDIKDIFGLAKIAAKVVNDDDEKDLDDYYETIINIPPNTSSILFNEIMYDPNSNQCEYIELYNSSNFDIEFSKFSIHDAISMSKILPFISNNYIFRSKEYLVIASDSSILASFKDIVDVNKVIILNKSLSLNNINDNLYLKWNNDKVIDSAKYNNSWHSENILNTKGVSLEKKGLILESNRKENWTSSSNVFGGTPTLQNTVIPQDNGKYGLLLEKNPFSFIENDFMKISYFCPYPNSIINLSIFDKNGLKLGVIYELGKGAFSGEIHWNGKIKNKSLPTGSYILYFECVNADTQELFVDKELFVIAN